jgi:hypothetical protein
MTNQLPVIRTDNPQGLPPMYAYRVGQGMVADLPLNPDHSPPKVVVLPRAGQSRKTTNGLTARADCMARWVAHGASIADAMRMAYRTKATGLALTRNANRVTSNPVWRRAVTEYTERVQAERKQASIPMRDFVTLRLAHEAQTAKTDAARVASLRLLGMTEGMFTTVHKRETTLDPKQLDQLKGKLEQRLRDLMARLGNHAVPVTGPEHGVMDAEILPPDPHASGEPLMRVGDPPTEPDTISGTRPPQNAGGTFPAEGPADDVAAGYSADFEGPLILQGGLKDS